MSLIDRDELLEILRIMQEVYFDRKIILGKVVEEVKRMPIIEPEPKWIPVSERLPDKADFYLTSSKSKQYPDDPYEVYTHISFYACGEWACTNRTVTAWMPLPESYRGDEDGQ